MSARRSAVLFVTLLVLAMLVTSCATAAPVATPEVTEEAAPEVTKAATPVEAPPTEAYPPAPEFIEIGGSIPLTGKFGSLGSQVLGRL